MRPVLFTLFGFPVRAYGTFIATAFLAGIWLAQRIAAKRRPDHVPLIETFATYALLAGIIGARLWEVAFTWDYYGKHLSEIPAIWHGGLSIQGGVVGGALVAFWLVRKHKVSFWDFADSLVPGVLLGQAIGRIGSCFLNGDAYGKPTGTSFGIIYQPGTMAYETFGPVRLWPAELFEGIWDLIIMGVAIWMLKRGRRAGAVTLWYTILYSAGRLSLEFLRADSLMIAGLKAAQLTSLIFIVVAGALLAFWQRPKDSSLEPQSTQGE